MDNSIDASVIARMSDIKNRVDRLLLGSTELSQDDIDKLISISSVYSSINYTIKVAKDSIQRHETITRLVSGTSCKKIRNEKIVQKHINKAYYAIQRLDKYNQKVASQIVIDIENKKLNGCEK